MVRSDDVNMSERTTTHHHTQKYTGKKTIITIDKETSKQIRRIAKQIFFEYLVLVNLIFCLTRQLQKVLKLVHRRVSGIAWMVVLY